MTIVYDNFDWNERVRHETTSNQSKHLSATTSKLILNPELPKSGLYSSMLNTRVQLTREAIFSHPGNQEDSTTRDWQLHWILEAITYAVPGVKEHFKTRFKSQENFWFDMPELDRLKPQKSSHYALGPIMENEGTLAGTYGVLKNIFGGDDGDCGFQEGQLGYKESSFDNGQIVLINGDEKTVGLLQSVQQERRFERRTDARLQWFIPVPGLFHWRMNYIDMVHDIFDGPGSAEDSLEHGKISLGVHRGSKTKFHHKEEVAIKTFYARVFAYFTSQLPKEYVQRAPDEILTPEYVLKWIKGGDITTTQSNKEEEAWLRFLALVETIQKILF